MLQRIAILSLVISCAFAFPIPQNETEWSWDLPLATLARDFSRASYCGENDIQQWSCVACTASDFKVRHVIQEDKNAAKLQGYIGVSESSKVIVVSFRGSTNLANWVTNLAFAHVDHELNDRGCDNCRIHQGWYNAYNDISQEVVDNVNALAAEFPDFGILATGHSLGAAIAVHAAVDLCVNHNLAHRLDMITFGEPRLGNEEFAKFCSEVIPGSTRIVHNHDIIPHLPPHEGLALLDFHHEAREVWNTDKSTGVKICDDSGEDDSCSKSVSLFRWSMKDHLWYLGAPSGCKTSLVLTAEEIEEYRQVEAMVVKYVSSLKK